MVTPAFADRIEREVRAVDFFRRSPSRFGVRAFHKEWQHFIIHGESVQLLVNFNLLDALWSEQEKGEIGRLIVLAREHDWDGDVDSFRPDEIDVVPGQLDARFGRNTMRFFDGKFHLSLSLAHRPIEAELELVPEILPDKITNLPLAPGLAINWVVLARLRATGTISIDGRVHHIDNALAYHDHNWGEFRWGDDFAWEWGSGLPSDSANPWSLLFVRSGDRGRHTTRCQLLYLWRENERARIFLDEAIRTTPQGSFAGPQMLKIPRVMGLAVDENACDVPERLTITGNTEGDFLQVLFEPQEVSQIVIPNETDLEGVTIVNETTGKLTLEGSVGDETVEMEGHGVFEFVRN